MDDQLRSNLRADLVQASQTGDLKRLKYLCEQGYPFPKEGETVSEDEATPLHQASWYGLL